MRVRLDLWLWISISMPGDPGMVRPSIHLTPAS